jgi:threonine synthase
LNCGRNFRNWITFASFYEWRFILTLRFSSPAPYLHASVALLKFVSPVHVVAAFMRVQVWTKMDALQPCGSFKLRGIGLMTSKLALEGASRFISSSGGNAGIAVA